MAKWKLLPNHFHGAKQYIFKAGGKQVLLDVAEDGTFEFDGKPPIPFHVFAGLVNWKPIVEKKD